MSPLTSAALAARAPSMILARNAALLVSRQQQHGALPTLFTRPSSMSAIVNGVHRTARERRQRPGGYNPHVADRVRERREAREAAPKMNFKIKKGKKDITEDPIPPPKTRKKRFYDPDESFGKKSFVYKAKSGELEAEVNQLEKLVGEKKSAGFNQRGSYSARDGRNGGTSDGEDGFEKLFEQRLENTFRKKSSSRSDGRATAPFDRRSGGRFERRPRRDSAPFERRPGRESTSFGSRPERGSAPYERRFNKPSDGGERRFSRDPEGESRPEGATGGDGRRFERTPGRFDGTSRSTERRFERPGRERSNGFRESNGRYNDRFNNRYDRGDRGDRGDRNGRYERSDRNDRSDRSNNDTTSSDMPLTIPFTTAASQFLYGRSVVEAALRSHRRKLYKLYMSAAAKRPRTRSVRGERDAGDNQQQTTIENLARREKVEFKIVDEQWQRLLDKMSQGRPHNGYVLEASPLPQPPLRALGRYTSGQTATPVAAETVKESGQDTVVAETTETTEASGSIEAAETAEAEPVGSTETVQATDSSEAAESAETESSVAAETSETATSTETPETTDAAEATETLEVTKAEETTETAAATEATEPAETAATESPEITKAPPNQSIPPGQSGFSIKLGYQSREDAAVNGTATFVPITTALNAETNEPYCPLVLLVDQVLDPGNLGGILRSANYLGVSAVVVSKNGSASMTSVVLKASAGAAEALELFSVEDPAAFLAESKKAGWKVYTAVAPGKEIGHRQSRKKGPLDLDQLEQADPLQTEPIILVVGSEGEGLPRTIRRTADVEVSIGNRSGSNVVDSLNVSVATGLLCASFMKGSSRAVSQSGEAEGTAQKEVVDELGIF